MAEAESKVGTVEQELWNIFTFYSLNGNSLDPGHVRQTQFVRFARDVGMTGPDATSEAVSPLLDADVEVAYTAQVNRKNRTGPKRMNYHDFLTAIMKLATRVYPGAPSVDEAFQTLLMRNILPHAWRRHVESVEDILQDDDVLKLYSYFGDALEQIFQFYGTSQVGVAAARTRTPGKRSTATGPGTTTLSRVSRSAMGVNTMKSAMAYSDFLKFAADFDLSNTVILSTRELGDIFLSALKLTEHEPTVRKLSFDEFWEALVRCSLRAYSKISFSTPLDRIRGLFLYMWRAITRSVPRAFTDRRNVSTYAGDLLSGAMLFNKRFTAMWAEDGYRDYLTPAPVKEESGADVLARLTMGGSAQSAQLLAATASAQGPEGGPGGEAAAPHGGLSEPLPGGVRLDAQGRPVPPTPGPDSPAVPRFGSATPAGAAGVVGAPPPPSGPRPDHTPKTLSAQDFYASAASTGQ